MNIIGFKKLGSHLMLIILSICYLVVLFYSQVCEASQKQINIAGLWRSNVNLEYKIFQNNTNFTWDVIGKNQKATGKINGLKVSASWQGKKGVASASGTIHLDSRGRAIAIKWSNGVVFKRDLPFETDVQENKTSNPSGVKLPGKTVDYQELRILLKLPGIEGESLICGHESEIDIESWSWEIRNQADVTSGGGKRGGKAIVGPLTVSKSVDKASALLILASLKGSFFSEATLVVRSSGCDAKDYLKITMSGVKITNVTNSGESGSSRLTESVTLVFSKICYKYTSQEKRCWDIEKNIQFF
jgi:type VI secretion system secreted protein Hcp